MVTQETIEKAKIVIDAYAREGNLKGICEQHGLDVNAFYRARLESPIIDEHYSRARKVRADVLADQVTEISDNEMNPHRARIQIEARKWACMVFNRAVYGEKVDMSIDGRIDLTAAMLTARDRAIRSINNNDDAQVIDISHESIPGPTDNKSADPVNTNEIDPFEDA